MIGSGKECYGDLVARVGESHEDCRLFLRASGLSERVG